MKVLLYCLKYQPGRHIPQPHLESQERMEHNNELEQRVLNNLDQFGRQEQSGENLKHAAVAIVIAPHRSEATFLLTRRTARLNTHAGQWALPGGRLDPGETSQEAALRELHEEVGITSSAVRVLGQLDDYPTRSGYLITPVIMWAAEDLSPILNPDEVASLHYIPLADLQKDGAVEFLSIPESDRPVIRLYFQDSNIHAPTAALLHQFTEVALRGQQTRVAHLEQPVWAWK